MSRPTYFSKEHAVANDWRSASHRVGRPLRHCRRPCPGRNIGLLPCLFSLDMLSDGDSEDFYPAPLPARHLYLPHAKIPEDRLGLFLLQCFLLLLHNFVVLSAYIIPSYQFILK
uniref:Uncharacterized protein n=1 Tax=Triticum urartu TaxID=4572 RepID=A0A8R7UHQ1_TRIUA